MWIGGIEMAKRKEQGSQGKVGERSAHMLIVGILSLCSVIIVFPYVWMVLTSFKTNADIMKNPTSLWPDPWTVSGYVTAVTKAPFLRWLANSLIVTCSVVVLVILTSTLIGFVFAKYRFPKKELLFTIILATMMVPAQVTMIPSFLIVNRLGLYNTLGALIVPSIVATFGIFMCRQFIEDIPDSLCEAAKIDGASDLTIYARIIVPNIRSAIGSLAIFMFLGVWNDYLTPLIMLNDTKRMTLPLALSYFTSQHSTDNSATMAVASLVMIPVLLVFIAFQKQFIKGVALSGIK